ncbi:MAG: serine/threonine-protein kinase [Myxococcota bacterium]
MTDRSEQESSPTTSSYLKVSELAVGGMGRVDLALRREGAFRRLYAVKRLHPHLSQDADFQAMFLEEARIAGLIQHPNVVSVLDVGEDAEGPFLIMDFVDGLSLSSLMRRAKRAGEPIPIQVCARIGRDMALGLHAAHELKDHEARSLGLVHRDLSPQNVLVGWNGAVRITDFGIAKALGRSVKTSTGILKGKISYMAPEQLRFEEPDRRSDLFALGVILFELLAGERLYAKGTGAEAPRRILNEPPPDIGEGRPEVPDGMVRLLFELLAKDREARPPTALDVATRLGETLGELVASEGAVEIEAWVRDLASELKDDQERRLATAVAEAESRPGGRLAVELPGVERSRRPPFAALIGIAAVAAIGGAAGGAWWTGGFAPSTDGRSEELSTLEEAEPPPEPSGDRSPMGSSPRVTVDEARPGAVDPGRGSFEVVAATEDERSPGQPPERSGADRRESTMAARVGLSKRRPETRGPMAPRPVSRPSSGMRVSSMENNGWDDWDSR